jgi:hypothetical protein
MDKRLKILLEEVKGSDPNLDTMDRNTRVRAGNYQFPFSGPQLDYLLLTLAKKLSDGDVLVFVNINEEPEGIANSLYQYLGFTEEELTAEQFKNGLKNAILAYKDGPIA